jgi:hypothetical protein
MSNDEIEINKAIHEELKSYPVIDFIETIPVDSFEMSGKIHFIQY